MNSIVGSRNTATSMTGLFVTILYSFQRFNIFTENSIIDFAGFLDPSPIVQYLKMKFFPLYKMLVNTYSTGNQNTLFLVHVK